MHLSIPKETMKRIKTKIKQDSTKGIVRKFFLYQNFQSKENSDDDDFKREKIKNYKQRKLYEKQILKRNKFRLPVIKSPNQNLKKRTPHFRSVRIESNVSRQMYNQSTLQDCKVILQNKKYDNYKKQVIINIKRQNLLFSNSIENLNEEKDMNLKSGRKTNLQKNNSKENQNIIGNKFKFKSAISLANLKNRFKNRETKIRS